MSDLVSLPPKSAEDALVRPVWSILTKGRTGVGKSILSASKLFRPTYVFNLEGRFESVISYYRKLDGHVKDLYYNDYSMGSGFYPLDKRMDDIIARPEFSTVVVAGLTSYIHIVLLHLMKSVDPEAAKKGKGIRRKGGIQVNILEDFNFEDAAIIFELLNFLQTLKENGVNIILECHISPYEIKTISEETGQREQQTVFEILTKGKKAPAQIPGYFNEVWFLEKIFEDDWSPGKGPKVKYRVNTVGSNTMECKTSFLIPSFEWTDRDPGDLLNEYLSGDIKNNPKVDPNKPKVTGW